MYQCTAKLGDQRAAKCLQVHFKKIWNIQVQTVMSRVNYESDLIRIRGNPLSGIFISWSFFYLENIVAL